MCGSKRSTNVHAMKRDDLRIRQREDGDLSMKKYAKGHDESPALLHATDSCCAEHYDCSRIVPAKTLKYGYQNEIEYDVMSCECDSKFRNCLKNANSYTADAVGHLYFNTLKIPCLTFEPEVLEAKSEQPGSPQESMNVVSVVPDAETERETVGGAQLVIAPRVMPNTGKESQHEQQHELHEQHDLHEQQPQREIHEFHEQHDLHEQQQPQREMHEFHEQLQQQQHEFHEPQHEIHEFHEQHELREQPELQDQHIEQHYTTQKSRKESEMKDEDDDREDETDEKRLKKNKKPADIMNPNPSPAPVPYVGKIRGVVTVPEAYYPKIAMQH